MKNENERKVGETYLKRIDEDCPLEEFTVRSITEQKMEDIKKFLETKSSARCFSEKYDLDTGKRKDIDEGKEEKEGDSL